MQKMFGVITAMVTPFTKDDRIDVETLKAYTEYLIGKGVNCLYPCGTTGEMLKMTAEERKLVAETVVNQAAGRVPVAAFLLPAWRCCPLFGALPQKRLCRMLPERILFVYLHDRLSTQNSRRRHLWRDSSPVHRRWL